MSPRGRKQRELVICRYAGCGTQTFEHMLAWHEDKCPHKTNGDAPLVAREPVTAEIVESELERDLRLSIAQAEAERKKELEKPVKIEVIDITGSSVLLKNDYRLDLVEALRTVPGRSYRGVGENMIPIGSWSVFLGVIDKLPNVKLNMTSEQKKEIVWLTEAPPWHIELGEKFFKVNQGPRTHGYLVHNIPGAQYQPGRKMYQIPLAEGWRLAEALSKEEGVIYDEDAQAFIVKQIEARATVDTIAQLEDAPEICEKLTNLVTIDGETKTFGEWLLPFQRVGIKYLDAVKGRGLCADEMGLGKTPQAIGTAMYRDKKKILFICQASLRNNIARQIIKFTGENPLTLTGADPTEYDLRKMILDPPKWTIINYDILGRKTEYTDVTKDEEGYTHESRKVRYLWAELINMYQPDMIIVDEGHLIKNVEANRSQAVRSLLCPEIIFLTGTPVLNRPGELWSMLTMIQPETFPVYEGFIKQYTYNGKSARNVEELRTLLRPIMIRRLKKDVQKDLPPINRIQEFTELSEKAKKLYQKVMNGIYEEMAYFDSKGLGGSTQEVANVLVQIGRLKQICAIDKANNRTPELAQELRDQTDPSEPNKVIIFTQYKAVAYRIAQMLGSNTLCFVDRTKKGWVTASSDERDAMVRRFQTDDDIHYIVVTEQTATVGHDMTAAGHVIFNDLFWTPAAHRQAEGRAYGRLNDSHSINAYYTITDMQGNSIDEWIINMLASKLKIINEVVEGVEEGRDESIAMALIEKLRANMWTKGS